MFRANPLLATKLIRNAARCRLCGDTVESVNGHDARGCSCGALIVDGGLAMIRRLKKHGAPPSSFEELSEAEVLTVEVVLGRLAAARAGQNPAATPAPVVTEEDIDEAVQWLSNQQTGPNRRR